MGAGNSAVVVDLPRWGPMLSPRVPHHVPIPGPRMERETPGQRPRPNYGHPQVDYADIVDYIVSILRASSRGIRQHRNTPRRLGALLAMAVLGAMLAVVPSTAHAEHEEDYSTNYPILEFNSTAGKPYWASPRWDSLTKATGGGTGGDGYYYTQKGTTDYVDYSLGNMQHGRYSLSVFVPRTDRNVWGRGATRPPTATRVVYKIWQKRVVEGPDGVEHPDGDWHVAHKVTLNQKKASQKNWDWSCSKCSNRYELRGETVIRVQIEESSSGRVALDSIHLRHRSLNEGQAELIEAAAGEIPKSECKTWVDWTLGLIFTAVGAVIGAIGAAVISVGSAGTLTAVGIAAALAWFAYSKVLQDKISEPAFHLACSATAR